MCKSKRIRISEDLFQRWKDLKRIRKARSYEELVAYLLDLATGTDLSDSPRYGERRTTVTSLSFISLHSFRHHVAFSTKFCKQTPRGRTFFFTHAYFTTQITFQDRHTVASVQGVNYYAYNFRGIAPLKFHAGGR